MLSFAVLSPLREEITLPGGTVLPSSFHSRTDFAMCSFSLFSGKSAWMHEFSNPQIHYKEKRQLKK